MDGKLIPQLEWEIRVGCAQATDEVVLERLDCAFCRIDLVVVWLHKLPFAFVLLEVSFERLDCLIVCDIELGLMSFVNELCKNLVKCLNDGCVLQIVYWFRKYCICVIIIRHEKILIAFEAHRWECTRGISVHCAFLLSTIYIIYRS